MKKILLLLLFTVASYGQAVFDEGIQITGNANSTTATKVNVQEANGKVNTQTIKTGFNKNIGLGGSDVVGATTLLNQYSTTPVDWTATAFNSGQVVFYAGKQWIAKIATVAGDVPSVSSKWEEITFEALANKTTTVDQTIIDGSTNAVSGNAVFDGLALKSNIGHTHVASQITDLSKASVGLGNVDNTSDLSKPLSTATINALATKAPISSVHNPVTLGTANGLSLSNQQLSLGLASSSTAGALSDTDWNTFNGKVGGTGTNNFLTKWSGTNTVNASGAWRETSNRLANATDNGSSDFQVTGQIDLKSKNTQGDGGQLGAELLTTGTGDASWTGTSFATGYTHATGSITTLTSALAPVINNLYQVAYTVTGRTAGSFTIAFGGTTTSGITSTGLVGDKASTTSNLVITPTSDFNGTIILSIKQITAGKASFAFRDNGGVIRNELRILGDSNTANGVSALQNNTTGSLNTANGVSALQNNTTGSLNTANGLSALQNNTTGSLNTANGVSALQNNTTGSLNTANGLSALQNNTTGDSNTANGVCALQNNTTGSLNTANGVSALQNNTTGSLNTANGLSALQNNTTGVNNTANGVSAGKFISNGATSLTVTNNSTFLGASTKALSNNSTNETVVGYNAIGDGNNTVSIGNTSVVSSRLRGRFLQGNVVDNLIDSGQFSDNVLATGFKTASGTASQFLKADGSVDSNTYLTSASLPTGLTNNFLPKWNGSGFGFGNSGIFDNGTNIGIGTTNPTANLTVKGAYSVGSSIPANWALLSAGRMGVAKNNKGLYFDIFNYYAEVSTYDWSLGQAYPMVFQGNGGNSMFGTNVDNGVDRVQVAGTISASPATTANQVPTWGQVQAVVSSGTYTPSNQTNAAQTVNFMRSYWERKGNVLTVTTSLTYTVTQIQSASSFSITLPNGFLVSGGANGRIIGSSLLHNAQAIFNNNANMKAYETPDSSQINLQANFQATVSSGTYETTIIYTVLIQ